MTIDISLIKKLRKITGVSISICKQALLDSNGKIEVALKEIKKISQLKSLKKIDIIPKQGAIFAKVSKDYKYGAIIEVNCETDFVSKNYSFQEFGELILSTAIKENINDIKSLKSKFKKEIMILTMKTNEKININRLKLIKGEIINFYLHHNRIGVIVSAKKGEKTLIKNIAMHIAANNPKYLVEEDVPKEILKKEYELQIEILKNYQKPKEILNKIAKERVKKIFREIILYNQNYIFDLNKTIKQILDENNSKIDKFIRFELNKN